MFLESIKAAQSTPADPTGTTSTTAVMMGLAGSLTALGSLRFLIMLSGDCSNNTTADGVDVQLSYGTGAAQANGGALAGTQIGGKVRFTALTGVLTVPFALQAVVSSLTLGTAYWIDAAVNAVTAGTASISNLSLTVVEL
mgnify:FL=1